MAKAWWRDSDYALFDRLTKERDDARAEIERMTKDWHTLSHTFDILERAYLRADRERDEAKGELEHYLRPASATESVRSAAKRRMVLDGADAQALENAITLTERERDEARAEVERLMHQLADATNESTHFQVMCKRETGEVERLTSELQRERIGIRPVDEVRSDAYRRGAEAMRDECIGAACGFFMGTTGFCNGDEDELEAVLEALPIPEEP